MVRLPFGGSGQSGNGRVNLHAGKFTGRLKTTGLPGVLITEQLAIRASQYEPFLNARRDSYLI